LFAGREKSWDKIEGKGYQLKFSDNPKKHHNICTIVSNYWEVDKVSELFLYNLENEKESDIQHFTNALTILVDKRLLITRAYIVPFDQAVDLKTNVQQLQQLH
jgi:hypothetical protein